MAMELELDDDVFFADISKQLNLLITDEDEQNPISLSSSVSFQGLFRGNYQTSATPYMMYNEQINYNVIRESKGTGVFIPRSSQPRRKHNHHPHQKKQGRFIGSFIPKQQFPHHGHDNNLTTLNNNNQESITFHHASTNPRRTYRDAASLFT
ncbi:unnamed protein product [Arabidopsis thaliana]|jgi:hypothetical protein|uniref:At3g06070 n=4 Tax=Arabidopsis TaxID=3701 RepID=Q8LED7_ARATH|nr:uncharacterized protein AT3G06070 [Arabidopsis thaliana]KAG7630226.1 hypothetical protein ISN44_As03g005880 [Arabidopsis suecica]AAM62705.1 unknown [Arabidopsis thaliana]ABI49455.1 At3g06070 [Arabidopsis thaliana]AEE74339.1 hypothetical protein AT3G06070 [Arabidopsis thaliana]CAA0381507.1 unnamed protein product [Arabidopsis thaliana]|eukprot:NP_566269.1 hypothetical protein AT3G06070 [Arabidopsis thaliana]